MRVLALFILFIAVLLIAFPLFGCASDNRPKCTWLCADPHNIPDSCACAEEIMGLPPCGKLKKGQKECQPQ
jgi:hypothetical protein